MRHFWVLLFIYLFAHCEARANLNAHSTLDSIAKHPEASKNYWENFLAENDTTAQALLGLGAAYYALESYEEARFFLEKSRATLDCINESQLCFDMCSALCRTMLYQSDYLNGYEQSLTYKEVAMMKNDRWQLGRATLLEGVFLYYLKRRDDSFRVFHTVFALASSIKDSVNASQAARNITARCSELDMVDSAMFWFRQSMIWNKDKTPESMAMGYALASVAMKETRDFPFKQAMLDTAMLFARQCQDSNTVAFVNIKQGEFFLIQNRLDEARKCASMAVETYRKNKNIDGITHALFTIIAVNEKEKNPQQALQDLRYIQSIRDTIYNMETAKKMAEFETKFKTAEKERENLILKSENAEKELAIIKERDLRIKVIFAAVLLLLLGAGVSVFGFYRSKLAQAKVLANAEEERLKSVIVAQNNERSRIAKDLHDSVAQSLAAIKLSMEFTLLKKFKQIGIQDFEEENMAERIGEVQQEVRAISHALMPVKLAELGFEDAIKTLLQQSFESSEMQGELRVEGRVEDIPQHIQIGVYRIAQELIANAIKHSKASLIVIEIIKSKRQIEMRYHDDGVGIDDEKLNNGIGLRSIKSRCDELGAKFHLNSDDNGLQVELIF